MEEKNEKCSILPILAILAKPILPSAEGSIGPKLLQGNGKKIFGGRKRRYRQRVEN